MNCPKCNSSNNDGIAFCQFCGATLVDSIQVPGSISAENINFDRIERVTPSLSARNINFAKVEREVVANNPTLDKGDLSSSGSSSERLLADAIKGEYSYGKLGLILGVSSIIGGIVLGLNGVAGSTSWTAKLLGLESSINDAAPGVVLFVVGLFMVWVTKPRVKLKDLQG